LIAVIVDAERDPRIDERRERSSTISNPTILDRADLTDLGAPGRRPVVSRSTTT
jgi:hypothetical protein